MQTELVYNDQIESSLKQMMDSPDMDQNQQKLPVFKTTSKSPNKQKSPKFTIVNYNLTKSGRLKDYNYNDQINYTVHKTSKSQTVSSNTAPQITIGERFKNELTEQNPGPSDYQIENYKTTGQTAQKFSLSSRHKELGLDDRSPGPANYEPKDKLILEHCPEFTIRPKTQVKNLQENPGVGTYDISAVSREIGITMGSRTQSGKLQDFPGPGTYNEKYEQTTKSSPKYSLQSRRDPKADLDGPGPGQYTVNDKQTKNSAPNYTLSGRHEIKSSQENPGPGQYTVKNSYVEPKSPKFTFGQKHSAENINKNPGPSDYQIENYKTTGQTAQKFSLSSRHKELGLDDRSPGPANYEPKDKLILEHCPEFTIRPKTQVKNLQENPGVGTYDISAVSREIGITMGSRTQSGKLQDFPGPGTYNEKYDFLFKQSPKFSLQSRRDIKIQNQNVPGPNQYEPNLQNIIKRAPEFSLQSKHYPKEQNTEIPGPDHYNPKNTFTIEQAPKFSLSGRQEEKHDFCNPGPGEYEGEKYKTIGKDSNSITLGSRHKELGLNDRSPGPAHYIPKDDLTLERAPVFTMKSRHEQKTTQDNPGVGQYDIDRRKEGHGITMGSRTQSGKIDNIPGPGTYYEKYNLTSRQSPMFSLASRHKQENFSMYPGPDKYDKKFDLVSRSAPHFSLSSRHAQKGTESNPGPGQYADQSKIVMESAPKFSLSSRQKEAHLQNNPGPGRYETQKYLQMGSQEHKIALGSRHKELGLNDRSPGPAHYIPKDDLTLERAPVFTMKSRHEQKTTQDNPGVGQYDIDRHKEGHGITMGSRTQSGKIDNIPGPGTYYEKYNLTSRQSPMFSLASRHKQENFSMYPGPDKYDKKFDLVSRSAPHFSLSSRHAQKGTESNPGPGQYADQSKIVMESAPKFSLSSRQKEAHLQNNPGPGRYETQKYLQMGSQEHKIALGSRHKELGLNDRSPGPAHYIPKDDLTLERAPVFTMKSRHEQKTTQDNPGVGSYNIDRSKKFKGITMGSRSKSCQLNNVPGPGAYSISYSQVNKKGPSFTLSSRYNKQNTNKIPGPGEYNSQFKFTCKSAPQYSLSSRHAQKGTESNPGPGQYADQSKIVMESAPKFSLSSRQKEAHLQNNPGPGRYETQKYLQMGSQEHKIALGSRHKELGLNDRSPGPAHYIPKDDLTLERAPVFTMKSRHEQKTTQDNPGVGQYDIDRRKEGHGITMGSRTQSGKIDNIPGPGTYYEKYNLTSRQSPMFSLASRHKQENFSMYPGPDKYDKKFDLVSRSAPHFSLSSRHAQKGTESNPGPGQYADQSKIVMESAPKFSLSSRQKEAHLQNNPGPGRYETQKYLQMGSQEHKIALGSRHKELGLNDRSPGPAHYIPKDDLTLERAPVFTMKSRHDSNIDQGTPGVGSYNIDRNTDGQGFSLASRTTQGAP
ncbi:SHIPPO_1-like protein [Hexamita inflata]|uniref:SHIPPO 1-like protein n=1 Tax=Hexamita inflata TaxID=28002 RepID=A0AA86NG89_9EUKA|nr:SHIPPO 1-like protein [Hexamita inflata]